MSNSGGSVLTPQNVEDYLLYVLPVAVAFAGFNWSGIFPGVPGLIAAAALGAFAKFLVGLSQNPKASNWEDYIPAIVIGLTFLATSLGQDPRLAIYGFYVALVVKSLPIFQNGFNVEDAVLFIASILAGIAQLAGQPSAASALVIVGLVGKTVPSIATNGQTGLKSK